MRKYRGEDLIVQDDNLVSTIKVVNKIIFEELLYNMSLYNVASKMQVLSEGKMLIFLLEHEYATKYLFLGMAVV